MIDENPSGNVVCKILIIFSPSLSQVRTLIADNIFKTIILKKMAISFKFCLIIVHGISMFLFKALEHVGKCFKTDWFNWNY